MKPILSSTENARRRTFVSDDDVVSVLLPCPDATRYPYSKERDHDNKYGASLHDAVRLVLETLCEGKTIEDSYDQLLEVVTDKLEQDTFDETKEFDDKNSEDQKEKMLLQQTRAIAAKQFVSDILAAAELFMARAMANIKRDNIGKLKDVCGFFRLNEETYRIDFTRTRTTSYDDQEVIAPCQSERNDLDEDEEDGIKGFVLTRSSQSTQVTLNPTLRQR